MALERDELTGWLRLALTPGVGNGTARKLLSHFGLPQAIFDRTAQDLSQCVGAKLVAALQQEPEGLHALLDATWNWLEVSTDTRRVLTLGDDCYPSSLLKMEDPPLMLYGMGTPDAWQDHRFNLEPGRCLAVVGSRNPTAQGAANARQFSHALAQAQFTIVSGLALGVDSAAHEGALEAADAPSIATVAVVGTGLDRVYPRQNRDLAHRISQHGLILSEYPIGTPPISSNFPKRNRLIAGLSGGTLVVEAALKSGSLITARLAVEQGKDVFAIPGSIHSTQARGCHALIKQGAKLVECAQDILEELLPHAEQPATKGAQQASGMASDDFQHLPSEDPLWHALGYDPIGLDALLARTGLDTASLQVRLMELELDGHITRQPGGLYQKLVLG